MKPLRSYRLHMFVQRCLLGGARAALVAAFVLFPGGEASYAADIIRGRDLYAQQCALCHGAGGMAVLPGAPDFARGDRLMQPDIMLLNQVRAGKGTMPGFQGVLPARDILSVIAYLRTLR